MTEPINSMRSVIRALRKTHGTLPMPINKAKLLRNPILYEAGLVIEDSYLAKLIEKNIENKKEDSEHGFLKTLINASDIRALYNSFTDANKRRFSRLVKAFDIAINKDKNCNVNKKMLEDMLVLVQGGEIRVVASTSARMLVYALTRLLGVKLKNFYGVSAGGFQAAGLAFEAPNCITFANTVDTDYFAITRKRKFLKEWLNNLMLEGYCFNTGKRESDLPDKIMRGEHLDEIGTNLQVSVSEITKVIPPKVETYFVPEVVKSRFGLNPSKFPYADALAASSNLWGLFYTIDWLTCGHCYIKDKKGNNHYQFDPGLVFRNAIPLEHLEKRIKEYYKNERDLPPFALVFGNKRVEIEEKAFSGYFVDHIDSYSVDPYNVVEELGAKRGYVKASCAVEDPFIKGNTAMLKTGNLKPSTHDREVLICANLPTSDFTNLNHGGFEFKPALDQMYKNFVDEEYVNSEGEKGKSPFQLYIDDVNKTRTN